MTNLFKKAHRMAKELKKQYPEVNYGFQFSLCLKYLQAVKNAAVRIYDLDKDVTTLVIVKTEQQIRIKRTQGAKDFQIDFAKSYNIKDLLKSLKFRFDFGAWVKHYNNIEDVVKDIELVSSTTNYDFNYAYGFKK